MRSIRYIFLAGTLLLSSCIRSYVYLIKNDNCNCEKYTYRDVQHRFSITYAAQYRVTDRIETTISLEFENNSSDTLDLRLASVSVKSENVHYEYNDKFLSLPYVFILPGDSYAVTLNGKDTYAEEHPWYRVAGEQLTVTVQRLVIGTVTLDPVVVTMIPVNPKFVIQRR
ncbi:MAG: hypothetical protein KGJ59_02635 [Bacteroidota bacterium]|nr:hypothetical protein [Bacteroidota bacterium]